MEELRQALEGVASASETPILSRQLSLATVGETLEGWLGVPGQGNVKRHGWTQRFVTIGPKGLMVFETEGVSEPLLVFSLKELHSVKPAIQHDLVHAKPADLPRIFQVTYARMLAEQKATASRLEVKKESAGTVASRGRTTSFVQALSTPFKSGSYTPSREETITVNEHLFERVVFKKAVYCGVCLKVGDGTGEDATVSFLL